jgi:hypothetical protein
MNSYRLILLCSIGELDKSTHMRSQLPDIIAKVKTRIRSSHDGGGSNLSNIAKCGIYRLVRTMLAATEAIIQKTLFSLVNGEVCRGSAVHSASAKLPIIIAVNARPRA